MKSKIFILILFINFLFSGCIGTNHDFRLIAKKITSTFGADLKKQIELGVGPAGISFASAFIEDDDLINNLIDNLNHVQIGVYNCEDDLILKPNLQILADIDKMLLDDNWRIFIRTIKNDSFSLIYTKKEESESLKNIFILSFSKAELVLMEVQGNLDEFIEIAVKEQGIKI